MIGLDLGAMDYYGIGYSNIRLPNSSKSYIYKYNTRINTFPEEVFLHEFLHSLERTCDKNMVTKCQLCMIMKNMDIKTKN